MKLKLLAGATSSASLRNAVLLGASMLSLIAAQPVYAQDVAANAGAAVLASGGVEDIVVTARKRAESTQDIPVSVTAISALQIERNDLSSLEKISASTPQLVIGRNAAGSGASIVLRGIGSNSTSIGIEQSVAVIVDGVYYGQGRVINEGFFDLERVEILKGPQALFFGKNATAGVISLKSADPGDRPEFRVRAGYEFRSENLIGEAVASGPLSETLGGRIAIRASNMFGGYIKNRADAPDLYRTTDIVTGIATDHTNVPAFKNTPQAKEFIGRATLKWEPTDRLTTTLKGSVTLNDTNGPAANYVLYNCPTGVGSSSPYGVSQLNANRKCGHNFVQYLNKYPADIAATIPHASDKGNLGNRYRSWAVTGDIDYNLDDITLTSVINYNWNKNRFRSDGDFVAPNLTIPTADPTEVTSFRAFSAEARALTSFDSPINALFGAYYQKTRRQYNIWTMSGRAENSAAPQGLRYLAVTKDSETKGETVALFGQVIWKILPQLEATGGVRYTHETKDSYFVEPYAHPTFVALQRFKPNDFVRADQTFTDWSPEITLTYKPTEDITIYGAYKTAFKSGGFSNSGIHNFVTTVEDFAFGPEKARGFEGGIKTTLFDRQLRLNLGAYRYKYTDLQVDFFNSPVFAFTTINAGAAITKGVELEFEYAPRQIEGFNLRGTVNYNKARYADFANAPCVAGQSIANGCVNFVQDLSGKPTAAAPEWTASLGANYETPISDKLVFGISADSRYSSSYLPSSFAHPLSRQGRYISIDASARVRTSDEHWELAVLGKNLTNRFIVTGAYDSPSTGSGTGTVNGIYADQIGQTSLPRTVELQLTWRY